MSWRRSSVLGLAVGLVMLGSLQGVALAQESEPGEDEGPPRCSGAFPPDPECPLPPGTDPPEIPEPIPSFLINLGARDRDIGGVRGVGGGNAAEAPAVVQESEQEAESGDVEQSFEVADGADGSNQCVGIQGAANTGNAQNQTSVIQYGSDADGFEFGDVGSSIEVSPSNSTSCDQQVNQAAAASGP